MRTPTGDEDYFAAVGVHFTTSNIKQLRITYRPPPPFLPEASGQARQASRTSPKFQLPKSGEASIFFCCLLLHYCCLSETRQRRHSANTDSGEKTRPRQLEDWKRFQNGWMPLMRYCGRYTRIDL